MTNVRSSPKSEPVLERAAAHIPLYKVLLHNDDHNTMEHVVKTLMKVFRFGRPESERIMLEAHRNGMALCTIEPLEQAELHRDQLRSFSLIASIEQA
ncbi:MAG: ATP-dependent Clp protease adaptor ClpS [Betaproteobacteria bacterium]